jgi:hypothetical protein
LAKIKDILLMNPKFIHHRFAQGELVNLPKMANWRSLEFFVFAEFLIKESRISDQKYLSILEVIACSDFDLKKDEASKLVLRYLAEVKRELDAFEQFTLKHQHQSYLVRSMELHRLYGDEGMKLLAERKFTNRPIHVVQKLLELQGTTDVPLSVSLKFRFDALSANRMYAELGYLVHKKRSLFGTVLSKELMFFLWFLYMALDPEDYAVRYLSTKSIEDLERTYLAYVRSNGGVHQTMVKLTREVKGGLRRFV